MNSSRLSSRNQPKTPFRKFVQRVTRRKRILLDEPSPLERVCDIWDLLAVAFGGTLGIGVFVVPGDVARKYAGPAVVVSITIAAFVTFLGCVSSLARGLSSHIDRMTGNAISYGLAKWLPMNIPFMSAFPDFLALVLLIILHGDPSNWSLDPPIDYIPLKRVQAVKDPGPGTGGFAPFGVRGVLHGASEAFFAFIGMINVATMSEEAIHPERDIPLAIIITSVLTYLTYLGVGIGLTMMAPYYQLDPVAPYITLFNQLGLHDMEWLVGAGALFSISASLFSSVLGLPRLLYAVAHDGLLFSALKKVHDKTKVPYVSVLVSSLFTGLMSLFFDLYQLIGLMNLLFLMCFTVVAICVILMRIQGYSQAGAWEETKNNENTENGGIDERDPQK
ncbi:cationic amino acid transporter 3-like [Ctenocephalides felis]|uniref:cationic amino acid transporter 3-like n=1 Tax=Ctenocephalides felis TaxID=7515 RepID=UPI000E6E3F76|nr:cationic amino acid transporter 3-like [Ctenocephalides felis]